MSNYATQPVHLDGVLPRVVFQQDLMRCVRHVHERHDGALHWRWRPHPYDAPQSIAQTLAEAGAPVELSRGSLQDDLDAADVVVSSVSSVLVDVAQHGLAVTVHAPPVHDDPEDILALLPNTFASGPELLAFFDAILSGQQPPSDDRLAIALRAGVKRWR